VGDNEGGLHAQDLVPAAGGEWHGLLFDNQTVGVPPALTWTFRIPFGPIDGEPAALDVDWLPMPAPGWRQLAGRSAASDSFAEPAESSVHYQGVHHRYERVRLAVTEQDGDRIRVAVTVAGDIDHLGPETVTADAWLRFTGIYVQLGGATSPAAARSRLAEFTDVDGLTERPDSPGVAVHFAPAA
jgi:hypothetical protein